MSKETWAIIWSLLGTAGINLLVVVYGFGGLNARMTALEHRVGSMEIKIDARFEKIENKLGELLIEFKAAKQVTDWRLDKLEAGKK